LHLGAQRSLFPAFDFRFWRFYTGCDRAGPRDIERHIQRLKDSGRCRFSFTSFEANANWMMVVTLVAVLVRWFQLLCFDGPWAITRPKALRWGIFHAPGSADPPLPPARRTHH